MDGAACDGCAQTAFVLHAVDGAKFCDGCAEKSERIDRRLQTTRPMDPVFCDGCGDRAAFDACIAMIVRECGGVVLCETCRPVSIEGEPV